MFNFITNTKINTCLFVWYNGKSVRTECKTQLCPFSKCMILGKSLNWSKPQFPTLQNEGEKYFSQKEKLQI